MYKSPIEIIQGEIQTKMEDQVWIAVQNIGINVDKEELIKALKYDRFQYSRGYEEGKADAMDSLARCKDCRHWCYEYDNVGLCTTDVPDIDGVQRYADDFCSYGERKDDGKNQD